MVTTGLKFVHPEYGLSEVIKYRDGQWICQQLHGLMWIFACDGQIISDNLQEVE